MICVTDHSTRHGRFKPPSFESLWDSSDVYGTLQYGDYDGPGRRIVNNSVTPSTGSSRLLSGSLTSPQHEHHAQQRHPLQRPATTPRENRSDTHVAISLVNPSSCRQQRGETRPSAPCLPPVSTTAPHLSSVSCATPANCSVHEMGDGSLGSPQSTCRHEPAACSHGNGPSVASSWRGKNSPLASRWCRQPLASVFGQRLAGPSGAYQDGLTLRTTLRKIQAASGAGFGRRMRRPLPPFPQPGRRRPLTN